MDPVLIILMILVFVCIFMLFRNNLVFKWRLKFNEKCGNYCQYCIENNLKYSLKDFNNLGTYNNMLHKFWIWNIREFTNDKEVFDKIWNFKETKNDKND